MADMFGFETPEEAQARILQSFTDYSRQAAATTSDPAQAWGIGMGNLFGPMIQKSNETRQDRKALVRQLMAEGLSKDAAEAQAKEEIEPGFRAVRQAEQMQSLSGSAFDMMAELTPELGFERAQAVSMLNVASRLRQLGMNSEAMQLSQQAATLMSEAAEREANLDSVKARTEASKASAAKSQAELGTAGYTTSMKNIAAMETLRTRAATAPTPEERDSATRQLGHAQAQFAHDTYIAPVTGRTEFDLLSAGKDPTFGRQQATKIFDAKVVEQQLALAKEVLAGQTTFDASRIASIGADAIGFAEIWLGREPNENDQAFMTRVASAKAGTAFVAAEVRRAMSGLVITQFEGEYIRPFLPDEKDSRTKQLVKLTALENYLKLGTETRTQLLDGGPGAITHFFETQMQQQQPFAAPTTPSATVPAAQSDDDFILDILNRK